MKKLSILDSTLRDGCQSADISFSLHDKQSIFSALLELGVDYIEAGNPASNQKDKGFFREQAGRPGFSRCVAFGSTCRKNALTETSPALLSLLESGAKTLCIFGKASRLHTEEVLLTTPEENLRMIRESIAFLKSRGRFLIFDAEHFFDGCAYDKDYAFAALRAAAEGGADILCLCDTNGAAYPEDVYARTKEAVSAFPAHVIGIHCHNDAGLAVASTMRAVDAGAAHVQGTLLGFGERAGNASLATLIPNLQLKRGYACIPPEAMRRLTSLCAKVADIANITIDSAAPYIGSAAFAHKGGMHVDAVAKLAASYEHVTPASVGNARKFLLSEVSGKAALLEKIKKFDPSVTKDSPKVEEIINTLKELEFKGYQFEAAEQSFELVIRRVLGQDKKFFELDHFKIIGEQPLFGRLHPSSALVKIRVNGISALTAAEGNGPINALDLALRKALVNFYPSLSDMRLFDYKVRVLDSSTTTAARVRVLIESTDGVSSWVTVGVSADILEASYIALADSIEYKLYLDSEQ